MRAFILAGGKGSRTANPKLPKVLMQVKDKTLLDHQLIELISIEEITQVTLLLGHGADEVIAHLKSFVENNFSEKTIDYVIENEPLGSAGMLRQVLLELKDEICFVALGDILPRGGIEESFHVWRYNGSNQKNIVFVHPNNHPKDSDSVERSLKTGVIDNVISSHDKTVTFRPNLSPVGFFILKISDVKFWPDAKKLDLVHDVLPALLKSNVKIKACDLLRRSLDVGTPERLKQVKSILEGVDMILNYGVFIDRDDTLIKDPTTILNAGKDIELMEGVIFLLRFLNNAGIPVICISNQPAIAKGQHTFQETDVQNQKIQALLSNENVYIDKWLYCPHHPEAGFEFEIKALKITCNCRKPQDGMIVAVRNQHNIDVTNSVIVGDTFRDIEIRSNLRLRFHFLPHGNCDILMQHICVKNFEQIKTYLVNLVEGTIDNAHR
jgi:histidinol-phosphate phosphatase family protein